MKDTQDVNGLARMDNAIGQLKKSIKLKSQMEIYNRDTLVDKKPRSAERLTDILDSYLETKTIEINTEERIQKQKSGTRNLQMYGAAAPVKAAQGDCRSWVQKGVCPRGDACG